MGGRVGLKGTDGEAALRRATELAAVPVCPQRAVAALRAIESVTDDIRIVTYPHEMGQDEVLEAGLDPVVIGRIDRKKTVAEDTRNAVKDFMKMKVDLVLFAGGDGTARDVCGVLDRTIPALGIPAGVKMHSSVFSVSPAKAGELVAMFFAGAASLFEGEVMDIDEDAFRANRLSSRLYGYMTVPYAKHLVQPSKSGSAWAPEEQASQRSIAEGVIDDMGKGLYFMGPGTTVKAVCDLIGIEKTLLGVDVIRDRRMLFRDANETDLLGYVDSGLVRIVVAPIGSQGFIFGRGNQQMSARVIRKVGRDNLIILATPNKLASLGIGEPLRVDTGDPEVDQMLTGYVRVMTGYREEVVMKVVS